MCQRKMVSFTSQQLSPTSSRMTDTMCDLCYNSTRDVALTFDSFLCPPAKSFMTTKLGLATLRILLT